MNEYKIEKLEDFLKVPRNRQETCLHDFSDFLDYLRFNIDAKVAAIMGTPEGTIRSLPVFNWCDDGEHGISKLQFFVKEDNEYKQVGEINI